MNSCHGILISIGITFILLITLHISTQIDNKFITEDYPSYRDCAPPMCGNSTIQYPFGNCGVFPANCSENQITIVFNFSDVVIFGQIIQSFNSNGTFQIGNPSNEYLSTGYYMNDIISTSDGLFSLSERYRQGSFYNCSRQHGYIDINVTRLDWGQNDFDYFFFAEESGLYYYAFDIPNCTASGIIIPDEKSYNISADKNFERLQHTSLPFTWSLPDDCLSCRASGGRCYPGSNCICRDGAHIKNCHGHLIGQIVFARRMAEVFFAVFALFSIVVVSCIVVHRYSCCTSTANEEEHSIQAFMDPLDSRPPSVENFLNYYSSQVPTRYSHTQIMTYTNNLAEKLGQGGFGTVYKGKLPSGRLIAVKVLDESKQSEQQFIAEVATVGTTCHVNLVRLLGYCSQVSRRALVYEYMVNGSLEKYIHGGNQDELDCKQLYTIALGTARGITYLHEECRNRILHFDIKPHNVLLDANFLPKVADFGLAKITDREESHISVVNRGTLGYAAPEMWSRMYGVVTDKSDVYSYGMLVMEMVGGRKNMDFHNRESRSSKFFYPEWAFKQVQKGEFGNLRKGNMSEEEESIVKKLSLVGLWCIQFNASRRPPMSRVIHMLEGSVEITTPPFPFPIDSPPQPFTSDQPSSSTYASDVQMANPTSTETVDTPFPFPIDPPLQLSSSDRSSALEIQMVIRTSNESANTPPFPFPVEPALQLSAS